MLNICSLFQGFFGFIKNINKKAYRTQAVILTGAVLVAVICFCAKDFGGSGKNASTSKDVNKVNVGAVAETNDTDDILDVMGASLLPIEREQVGLENSQESLVQSNIEGLNYLNKSTGINESERDFNDKIESFENIQNEITKESASVEKETEVQIEEIIEETTEVVVEETTVTPVINNQVQEEPVVEETVAPSPVINSCISMTDEEYQWLLKIVEAEAGDQDDIGKILVVNVIFNRVRSSSFPNSVMSVIFQNSGRTYQFQPVKNGRIYDMNPSQNTIECVNRAMNGEDYSNGALFFTMRTSSNSWFNTSLKLLFVHGDHYFYNYY